MEPQIEVVAPATSLENLIAVLHQIGGSVLLTWMMKIE
jgi:hypothetical protein